MTHPRPAGDADAELLDELHARLARVHWTEPATADYIPADAGVEADAKTSARLVGAGGAFTWISSGRGSARTGLLSGWDYAAKDMFAIAGRPLGAGSEVRAKAAIEPVDARMVRDLDAAGACLVGTTALHEFGFGVTGVNPYAGTPPNPNAPGRVPGGSSSGSAAAVADGTVRLALGTDTGGSVRIPAALCGVVGFKPRFGSYPTQGVFPLAPSLDHVGTLARNVGDIIAVHDVISDDEPVAADLPLRIGIPRGWQSACDAEVVEASEAAFALLSEAGSRLIDVEVPDPARVMAASTAILLAEAAAIHEDDVAREPGQYGSDIRARLATGLALPATVYVDARRMQRDVTRAFGALIHEVDVIAEPTSPMLAPELDAVASAEGAKRVSQRLVTFTRRASLTGAPAISLPVATGGLPVGLQLIAATNHEVLSAALAVEAALAV